MDIQEIQSQGVIVKLAYGGEEWGNTDAEGKVYTISLWKLVQERQAGGRGETSHTFTYNDTIF